MTRKVNNRPPWRLAGFTLVEMILSTLITGIVMLSIGSVMVVAGRGLDNAAVVSGAASQTDRAVQMIVQDLNMATSISESTANAVTMIVPTRNGDANPETIRYAWSGQPGDPLTRAYNGAAPATVAANVYQFQLTYLRKTVQPGP